MAAASRLLGLLFLLYAAIHRHSVAGTWCVVRSEVSDRTLQAALDYACGAGADCAPLRSSGLCHLPNTVQAHASYAFNSYYQRKGQAPGTCSFAGAATIASTDPSYGSCVYPSSPRTAGLTEASGMTPGGGLAALPTTIIEPPWPAGATTPFRGGAQPPPDVGMEGSTVPNPPGTLAADASRNAEKITDNFNFKCFMQLMIVLVVVFFQIM